MHLFKFEQTASLQDNCNNGFAFYYTFLHSLSLISHLHNLIFSFREENIKKCLCGSREKCSFCCWRSGILEVRCTPVLNTKHETQRLPSCLDFHLLLLFSFSKCLPSSASQHLCSFYGLSIPQLLPQRNEKDCYPLAVGKHERISLLGELLPCPPLSASLFLPFSFKKIL